MNNIDPHTFNWQSYRMPAEWAPHRATWLAWPSNPETWPCHMAGARRAFIDIITALLRHEAVRLLVPDASSRDEVTEALTGREADLSRFEPVILPYNDSWMRDAGPIFVVSDRDEPRCIAHDFIFNAWGDKYQPWDDDDAIPSRALAESPVPVAVHRMVLEGGSIDVNGQGTLLTTEQCLLNPNRNPSMNREEIESALCRFLGLRRVIWLGGGIEGDDTDGHVDDISRFVNETTVLTVRENNRSDANFQPLEENFRRLRQSGDQDGNRLTVVDIPMPNRELHGPFGRSPASYANFLIANRQVLVPVYGAPNEDSVLSIFEDLFPGREIVPIDCVDLVCGLGSIHCVTQQEPTVAL